MRENWSFALLLCCLNASGFQKIVRKNLFFALLKRLKMAARTHAINGKQWGEVKKDEQYWNKAYVSLVLGFSNSSSKSNRKTALGCFNLSTEDTIQQSTIRPACPLSPYSDWPTFLFRLTANEPKPYKVTHAISHLNWISSPIRAWR